MTGNRSIKLESKVLAKITRGMESPKPNHSSSRLPLEAPATASTLSSDMVTSATVMIQIA